MQHDSRAVPMTEIFFKPTTAHSHADGLSRLPLQHTQPALVSTDEVAQIFAQPSTALAIFSQQLGRATLSDTILSKVFHFTVSSAFWYSRSSLTSELTVEGDCVLLGIGAIVPKKFQEAVLHELHELNSPKYSMYEIFGM